MEAHDLPPITMKTETNIIVAETEDTHIANIVSKIVLAGHLMLLYESGVLEIGSYDINVEKLNEFLTMMQEKGHFKEITMATLETQYDELETVPSDDVPFEERKARNVEGYNKK